MISKISPFFANLRNLILALLSISLIGVSVATDFLFRHELKRQARKEIISMGLEPNVDGIITAIREGKLALLEDYETAGVSFGGSDLDGMTPLHAAIEVKDKDALEQVLLRHKQVKRTVDIPTPSDGMTPLKRALNDEDFPLANRLIDQLGADPEIDREPGLPYLIDAIQSRNEELIDYLLSKGVDVNRKGTQPHSALSLAADQDNLELMQRLVAQGASITTRGVTGYPLVLEAALEEEYTEMAFLLEKGADVDEAHAGKDVLSLAMKRQDGFMKWMALEHGASVDRKGNSGEHWIVEAARGHNHDWFLTLLDKGISIDYRTRNGDTLLLDTIRRGDLRMVDFLIEQGADINARGKNDVSPLQFAIAASDTALVRTLVENRAEIYPGEMLSTAYRNRDNPTMNLLLNAGVDPETEFKKTGKRLMDVAVAEGSIDTVRTLLRAGAEIGDNLWGALLTGQDDLVEIILDSGANPEELGPNGDDPLEFALNTHRFNLVKPLLDAGANPNPMFDENESWVSRAVRTGDNDTALALIEAGASLGSQFASDGHSLLGWSIANEADEVAEALVRAGVDVNVIEPYPAKKAFIDAFDESSTFRRALRYDRRIRPLMMAAVKRNHEVAQVLVDAGAQNHTTAKYMYPISIAAWYSDVRMMQIIYGRDPDYQPRKIIIDLSSQRVTLYEDGKLTYSTACSTGRSGKRTPTGTYAITQKNRHHTSSIYGSSMPYFMRLSCRDFGLHQGNLPGYPASAGCIRLSWSAAAHLFRKCSLGDLVIIQH